MTETVSPPIADNDDLPRPSDTAEAAAADLRSRRIALYVLCVGMLMIVVDGTVVNVALPAIQKDLAFSSSGLAWVVNAYLIAFGGLLLFAGRLGDLVGRRRVFLGGITLFTIASLACALAQTSGMLIGARLVQGIGGALTSSGIIGMIVTMFPEPRAQAKAIGTYGFVASSGGSIGLIAGGLLTQTLGWHSIFLVNIPIGIVTVLLTRRYVVDEPGLGLAAGLDLPGAVLLTAGVMLGVLAILGISSNGSRSALEGAGAVALIAAFAVRQSRIAAPLIPLRLFRSRNTSGSNVVQALLVVGMFGMFFLTALYLQQVIGYGALAVGLAFAPTTTMIAIVSLRFSEPLSMRFGAVRLLTVGTFVIAAGMLLLLLTPSHGSALPSVIPATILVGLGAGASFPALTMVAMSDATEDDAGAASGLLNTSLQVGGALGLAILASVASARTSALRRTGHDAASAATGGYHLAYLVAAGLLLIGSLIAIFVLREPEHDDDRPTGHVLSAHV